MNCKNCNEKISLNFCPQCGQKATVKRFGFGKTLVQDFLQGVFQLNKGFLFTIKELFLRPGHGIREYMLGKRAPYFNYFGFIVIVLTVSYILQDFSEVHMPDILGQDKNSKEALTAIDNFSREYPKLFMLMIIPFNALFSFLWFKKAKQNYLEHVILNTYKSAAELIIVLPLTIVSIFYVQIPTLLIVYWLLVLLSLFYSLWFFYQYFSAYGYKKANLLLRSFATTVSMQLLVGVATMFFVGVREGILHQKQLDANKKVEMPVEEKTK